MAGERIIITIGGVPAAQLGTLNAGRVDGRQDVVPTAVVTSLPLLPPDA